MTARSSFVFAAALAMSSMMAGSVLAQSSPAEQRYYDLTAAWVAYERCNNLRFDQGQQTALNQAIAERVGPLGAGEKLSLLQSAKMRTSMRVATKGCGRDNAPVAQALALFSAELAPVVGL